MTEREKHGEATALAEAFPLRVEAVPMVSRREWRCGESRPAAPSENWQMVYVADGAVEEVADNRRVPLHRGWALLHQPGEMTGMTAMGEIPPEVVRINFVCNGAQMDLFRNQLLRVSAGERAFLQRLLEAAEEIFATEEQTSAPPLRPDPPFAASQQLCALLELLLIYMARRLKSGRQLSTRARREKEQTLLLETVKSYFVHNLSRSLTVEEVCRENDCTRAGLQKLFRSRTKSGAMEYFAALKVEHAKELLASGCTPGETAARLGYSTGAYFSRCFRQSTGMTPHQYQVQRLREELGR